MFICLVLLCNENVVTFMKTSRVPPKHSPFAGKSFCHDELTQIFAEQKSWCHTISCICCTLKSQTKSLEITFFGPSDLDLWPMTLPIELDLNMVQADLLVIFFVRTSNGSAVRVLTDRQTHGHTDGTNSITSSANAGGNKTLVFYTGFMSYTAEIHTTIILGRLSLSAICPISLNAASSALSALFTYKQSHKYNNQCMFSPLLYIGYVYL